jgi:hypothetical protein
MNKTVIARKFIVLAGVLLIITAVAKLISANGSAPILEQVDPILSISFRNVFWAVGFIELVFAGVCLFGKRLMIQAFLLAWLATNFAFYRLGLKWMHYQRPCPCLGNLADALHIPPRIVETIMIIIMEYLLIGSYLILIWAWNEHRKRRIFSRRADDISPSLKSQK